MTLGKGRQAYASRRVWSTLMPSPGNGFWLEVEMRSGDRVVREKCGERWRMLICMGVVRLEQMLKGKLLKTSNPVGLVYCGKDGFIWNLYRKSLRGSGRYFATSNRVNGQF